MSQTKKFTIVFLLFTFVNISFFALHNNQYDKLKKHIERYCPASMIEQKERAFTFILDKMPPSAQKDLESAIDAVLPSVCFYNYPDWLLDRVLNLAVYAAHEGSLKPETIRNMTRLMPIVSLGKRDYMVYGELMENLRSTGMEMDYVNHFIVSALEKNYGSAGVQGLAYYYVISAAKNHDHRESLENAFKETKLYNTQSDRFYVLKQLFEDDKEKDKEKKEKKNSSDKPESKEETEKKLEKSFQHFWRKYRNRVRLKEKYDSKLSPIKNQDAIVKSLTSKIGTQYGYRSNKGYAVDETGLISFITGIPVDHLPYEAAAYCSAGTVGSVGFLKAGDVILLSAEPRKREVSALGIYLDNKEFLRVTIGTGVVKSSFEDSFFKDRFIKGCRLFH